MLDKFERVLKFKERKHLHCIVCKRSTIHNLEARCKGSWDDHYNQDGGAARYSIFRCGACDYVSYETVSWDTYSVEYDENDEIYHPEVAVQYPAPVSAHFNFNTDATPRRLNIILDETLHSLASAKMVLATIGLRLAVEFIVNDKKCAGHNLEKKIDDLETQGHVDNEQKELLHRIRKHGNAGAHEAKGMEAAQLVAGLGIVDGLLEKFYNGPARHRKTIEMAKVLLKDESDENE